MSVQEKSSEIEKAPLCNEKKVSKKPHFHGHRQRLREKFQSFDGNILRDYELLELILFSALPRRDTKPIAKELIRHFGSFAEVITAPAQRLAEIDGVGESAILQIKLIEAAAQRLLLGKLKKSKIISCWTDVLDYCKVSMGFSDKEQFRILFLDKKNALIADEIQQKGTIDHAPVYPREVVKRAIELSATAIILLHNHPSGDPSPSAADIAMTNKIVEVALPLGIRVHDHVIITKSGYVSMKGLCLF